VPSRQPVSPRERVLLALAHQETDRVPVDFLGTPEVRTHLRAELGEPDDEAVLRRLGADLRHPRQPYIGPALERRDDGSWRDPWGVWRRAVSNGTCVYDEICEHPLAGLEDASELIGYAWPEPEWWDPAGLRAEINRLDSENSYAIALVEFGDPGGIFETAWYLRSLEQFLMDLVTQPEIAFEIMRRVTDFYVAMIDQIMRAAGERIDLVWTSDDIAHQRGRLLSEKCWRELVAPHHVRLNRRVHQLGARVMYHSCGSVRTFIPGLIEIGVDVLDVLQFSAVGMDPREIKSLFGDRLCFHGGMDVQCTLPRGTEDEVRQVTRELIEVLGQGGGYILSPTHNIQPDTPTENILAMYAEAGSLSRQAWQSTMGPNSKRQ
jgi:uroporphyrinogen decarboxylase